MFFCTTVNVGGFENCSTSVEVNIAQKFSVKIKYSWNYRLTESGLDINYFTITRDVTSNSQQKLKGLQLVII